MHFRPFSERKKSDFSDFFSGFADFWYFLNDFFLTICLILGFPPWNPRFPTGPPFSFYIKNSQKIGFPMPTLKNGFQFLNLHPKKHIFKEKIFFFLYFCLSNQGCGVGVGGVACFQLESESVFKTAGVGFLKLLESESVFQNCWSRSRKICYRLQCLLINLNYNINCLKIITGYWKYWL